MNFVNGAFMLMADKESVRQIDTLATYVERTERKKRRQYLGSLLFFGIKVGCPFSFQEQASLCRPALLYINFYI